jgi:hypothetical protein
MDKTVATHTYIGIADAHGIESFFLEEKVDKQTISLLNIRAMANRHRHACLYKAELTQSNADIVLSAIGDEDWPRALELLKKVATNISVPRDQHKSFCLIPNEMLDPYYG